jgi:hypothetical protein
MIGLFLLFLLTVLGVIVGTPWIAFWALAATLVLVCVGKCAA